MKSPSCILVLTLAALVSVITRAALLPQQSQASPQTPPAGRQEPEPVFRITTQLVQIDAVVTDKKGDHVDDLNEDDFELFVDGKKRKLSFFRTIRLPEAKRPETPPAPKGVAPDQMMPTRPLAQEQVRRTIAFVVDDLGLSFDSTYYAREALRKFVSTQMQEGDLVAIVRTGRGLGALQQFTSDKRILSAAIEKLVWNPNSREMIPRFGSASADEPRGGDGGNPASQRQPRDRDDRKQVDSDRIEDFRETVFTYGTLGAVNFVVRGMRELPGRKIAVLISDGFPLFGRDRDNTLILQRVRRLVDLANRSSVVIYSLDAKGLQTIGPTAADNLSGLSPQQIAEQYSRASQALFESQEGLSFIAGETGGFAVFNNNDLNFAVQRVMKDNQSYYLLGFDPDNEQWNGRFHTIKVKLKRPGLQVRTRAGYFGIPETEARERPPQTRERQILGALFSPFGARDIQVQMTSSFFNSAQDGSFIRSLLHIDPSGLTFRDGPDGKKVATFDLAAFTFDERGAVIESDLRMWTLPLNEESWQRALKKGIDYQHDVAVKKPGAYQFRTVIRDAESTRLGSAGQFIQVPDLNKKRLAVSGLVLTKGQDRQQNAAATPQDSAEQNDDVQPTPHVRRFARSGFIDYAAIVYNPAMDKATGKPRLNAQIEIYRNGRAIYQAPDRAVSVPDTSDPKRIVIGGQLKLSGLEPGDYLLHLVVTDALARPRFSRVEQWMDFSVR
ncbi:MAG: VWA domain-containing protein [Blastocatellia bacterium]